MTLFVKPNPDRAVQVYDPEHKNFLPAHGAAVPSADYWHRRLTDGDVVQITHEEFVAGERALAVDVDAPEIDEVDAPEVDAADDEHDIEEQKLVDEAIRQVCEAFGADDIEIDLDPADAEADIVVDPIIVLKADGAEVARGTLTELQDQAVEREAAKAAATPKAKKADKKKGN